jgi:hypothetical protein
MPVLLVSPGTSADTLLVKATRRSSPRIEVTR